MKIRAFQGLRPDPQLAASIASLPYDVVNTTEAKELAKGNPNSFLHVVRAEIDLPEETDLYSDPVYAKAKENLDQLQASGALVREEAPSLYVYQQIMNGHRQKGLVSVCHIDDYLNDLIKKHEKTRPQKEDDRTKLNATLSAHPGPVFLTYRDDEAINATIEQITQEEPLIDFTAPDGVQHTVWRVGEPEGLVDAFSKLPVSYVADGHHRSAAAARVRELRRQRSAEAQPDAPWNWFLAVLFPAFVQFEDYPFQKVHESVGAWLQQQGAVTLDLLPYYKKYDPKDLIASFMDGHPNKLGHKIAADAIYETIRTHPDLKSFLD